MVLGHEGVGVVEELGPDVQLLNKGDRVGWGYATDSCGHCLDCIRGQDIFCARRARYGSQNLDQGSFASHGVWREAFLAPVPDGMSDVDAAPMQCAGATVFTALYDARATDTVGIMGVGGLGHLAIQFANKIGCRVVVISGSDRKREQALKLGAHRFIAMNKGGEAGMQEGETWFFNRLLVTTSAQPDWEKLLPMMAPRSRIFPLSVSLGNLEIPYMPLIFWGIAVQGSITATRTVHREMLMFAARHKITPMTETFPMTEGGIVEAMDRLEEGKVHYRAVLVPE